MAALPTVSMTGWDAVGKTLQELVLKSVVSRLEREGVKIFSPYPVARERPKPVICSDFSVRGAEKNPYPVTAPRFIFLLVGEGLVFVQETWYHLTAGHGIFVPCNCPYLPHGMLDNLVPEGHWLWVSVHPFGATIHHCRLTHDAHYRSPVYAVVDERIPLVFEEWEKEAIARRNPNSLISKSLLLALFHFVTQSAAIPLSVWAEIAPLLPKMPPSLRSALIQLVQNFDSPCRIEEIAKQCGMSLFHLFKLFRKFLGTTPNTFMRRLRLEVANQMLTETQLSPYEVCQLVGYSNYNYFRKQFQRLFGVAPCSQ